MAPDCCAPLVAHDKSRAMRAMTIRAGIAHECSRACRHVDKMAEMDGQAPKPDQFVFARLRYASGDWDYNPKVAANVLNSVVEYTNIPVYPEEIVIGADSTEL